MNLISDKNKREYNFDISEKLQPDYSKTYRVYEDNKKLVAVALCDHHTIHAYTVLDKYECRGLGVALVKLILETTPSLKKACVYAYNTRSLAILTKFGFVVSGMVEDTHGRLLYLTYEPNAHDDYMLKCGKEMRRQLFEDNDTQKRNSTSVESENVIPKYFNGEDYTKYGLDESTFKDNMAKVREQGYVVFGLSIISDQKLFEQKVLYTMAHMCRNKIPKVLYITADREPEDIPIDNKGKCRAWAYECQYAIFSTHQRIAPNAMSYQFGTGEFKDHIESLDKNGFYIRYDKLSSHSIFLITPDIERTMNVLEANPENRDKYISDALFEVLKKYYEQLKLKGDKNE